MERIDTPWGPILEAQSVERRPDGGVASCVAGAESPLDTPWGQLMPQHAEDEVRRPRVEAVEFHPDGGIRRLPLQESTSIATPAGTMPAELVTLHPNSALRRVFPLYGRCCGYWSWRDEHRLAPGLDLATPQGPRRLKAMSVLFAPDGSMASLTFWPGETHRFESPAGPARVRVGIAFHPSGAVRSLEPADPLAVETPLGRLQAYDPDPCGITGDVNSLRFAPDGRVEALSTIHHLVRVVPPGAKPLVFGPGFTESACGDGARVPVPLRLELPDSERVVFPDYGLTFALAENSVAVEGFDPGPVAISIPCA
jgi:hypothetical protein